MYPIVRVVKRIPDGSIWQARRSYLLPSRDGWARVYAPMGTEWSNALGGWPTPRTSPRVRRTGVIPPCCQSVNTARGVSSAAEGLDRVVGEVVQAA